MEQKKLTAQIAAAYFGCQVTDGYFTGTMIAIRNDTVTLQKNGATAGLSISECQLMLTPLSKFTDEDALELSKLYKHNFPSVEYGRGIIENCYDSYESYNEITFRDGIIVDDYLRSKYYDCGYGSILSLIEAGIAVDKSKIK